MTRDEVKKVIAYTRVSTDEQGRSGLGLEAQEAAIRRECEHRGWELVEVYTDVASGRSTNGRHELRRALDDLAARRADALIVAKLDRLSRSVVDLGKVLELSRRHSWALVILDPDIDTSGASGKLMANVLISVAEWERDVVSERTKAAFAAKLERGERIGAERKIPPALERRIVKMRAKGLSFQQIAARLDAEGLPTPNGGTTWSWTTVGKVVRRNVREEKRTRRRRADLG